MKSKCTWLLLVITFSVVHCLALKASTAYGGPVRNDDVPIPSHRRHDDPLTIPQARYSGTVLSTQGSPVPGASVLVRKTGTEINAKLFTKGRLKEVISIGDFDSSDYKNWVGTGKNINWYLSGGANFIRPRTALRDGRPDSGSYGLMTYGNNDAPANIPNVECTWYNPEGPCGMAWGPFFRVEDDTKSISFYINGGNNALDLDSMHKGGTGVALWDVDAAQILKNTFVTGTNSWKYSKANIPLTGLKGKTVGFVVIDHKGSDDWAFIGVDSINAPSGSITPSKYVHHRVVKAWDFDIGESDMAAWNGDIDSFKNGHDGGINHYINLKSKPVTMSGQLSFNKAQEPGWLSSRGGATGTIQTDPFTIDGDIIEFYLGGGGVDSGHFDLVRASDDKVLFSKYFDKVQMAHSFWSVKQHQGVKAYLRVVDNDPGGSIMLDAIRMVDFNHTGAVRTTSQMPSKFYTENNDEYVETPNPIIADKNGMFSFFIVGGDYDLHISSPSVNYSLNDITIVNPFISRMIQSSSQPPLTVVERAGKTRRGNTALVFNRPGSKDGNNPQAPYRIIVNKGECGWALTHNADWDEINGTWWPERDCPFKSMFFRINGKTHALEYGGDYRHKNIPPVMETLVSISPEGNFWLKSHFGRNNRGVSMIAHHNVRVNGAKVKLRRGDVVVLDPDNPFSVIAPRKHADINPVVVCEEDSTDPSLVHVVFSGASGVNIVHTGAGVSSKAGAALVTEGKDSLRAELAPAGVDPRAIIGYLHSAGQIAIP